MVSFGASVLVGFLLGLGLGVGCALAVMYSIYMGGYRTALREAELAEKPERYIKAVEKLRSSH